MKLSPLIKEGIRAHAFREKPNECCGLIIEGPKTLESIACTNVSETPEKHFSLRSKDYVRASKKGKIKAVYHSHISKNDKFSPNDMMHSRTHQVPFILYSTGKDCFSTFDPKKNKTFLYEKPFAIGSTDCYLVVKEYYKDLGIELADIPGSRTNLSWHKKNPRLIQELFELNKQNPDLPIFELPANSDMKKHDVIVFEFLKGYGANHVAIYLGDGTIIHHPRNKYMCIEPLSEIHTRKIHKIYRHKKYE